MRTILLMIAELYRVEKVARERRLAGDDLRLVREQGACPGLGGHLKTGHTWPRQNRPTEPNQDKSIYNPRMGGSANIFRNPV